MRDGITEQPSAIGQWSERLEELHARIAGRFARSEARERVKRYFVGLLGRVERKNGWQLAEAMGETDPQGVQRLLNSARWDGEAVREDLLRNYDPSRRAEAGVPEEVTFANKIELAKRMLQRAFAAGIPARWVAADSFYGRSHQFPQVAGGARSSPRGGAPKDQRRPNRGTPEEDRAARRTLTRKSVL